jgi:hypothetical protein
MISSHKLVYLTDSQAYLVVYLIEIEVKGLFLISELCLDHFSYLFQIIVYRLLNVNLWTLNSITKLLYFLQTFHPSSEPDVAPPSLQAL